MVRFNPFTFDFQRSHHSSAIIVKPRTDAFLAVQNVRLICRPSPAPASMSEEKWVTEGRHEVVHRMPYPKAIGVS